MLVFVTMEKQKDLFLSCFRKSIKYIVLIQGNMVSFHTPLLLWKQTGRRGIHLFCISRPQYCNGTYLSAGNVSLCHNAIDFLPGREKKEKFQVIMVVLLVVAGYKYCYNAYNWDILAQKENEKK